jgi:hypothetical protein
VVEVQLKRAGGREHQSLRDKIAGARPVNRGDVLLSHGNTRVAALIRCITQSPGSHVSMYVGPLDDGPDPLCVVEADMAAGVRSIRRSELNALLVRVRRDDRERRTALDPNKSA